MKAAENRENRQNGENRENDENCEIFSYSLEVVKTRAFRAMSCASAQMARLARPILTEIGRAAYRTKLLPYTLGTPHARGSSPSGTLGSTLTLRDFQGERSGVAGKRKDARPEGVGRSMSTPTLWSCPMTGRSFTAPENA